MSFVTFEPKKDTEYNDGWPEEVIGDGFINLTLEYSDWENDFAVYSDQFGDEYEFSGKDEKCWSVDVREDG